MRISKLAKIFIVEDNFVYSYMLNGLLEDLGDFNITILSKGEECLDMLDKSRPTMTKDIYTVDKFHPTILFVTCDV